MSVPRLNRQLVLEAPTRVADGAGGFTESWVALGTLWAEVTARSGREQARGDVGVTSVDFRILVRAEPVGSDARPSPEQRFREGDRLFRIDAVAEHDPAGRYLACFTTEEAVA